MKRVILTGGAGFIGSHLCTYLLEKGFAVTCIDNLLTGKKENIAPLLDNPHFQFKKQDVTQYIELSLVRKER